MTITDHLGTFLTVTSDGTWLVIQAKARLVAMLIGYILCYLFVRLYGWWRDR